MGSRANSDVEDNDYGDDGGDFDDDSAYDDHVELTWEAQIKEAIEELNEKRSSTREEALTKLQAFIAAEALDSQRDDLMELLKKSVKKGAAKECILACNVISLVFITIGEDDEKMFTDLAPLLKYTITNHENTEVKAACIYALSTACFISSTPQPSHLPTYDLLSFFSEIAISCGASVNASQNPETLKAALESYSVLYANLFQRLGRDRQLTMQARRYFNNIMPALKSLLDHSNVDVRVASGETVALMLEILDDYQRKREDEEFSDDEAEASETYNDDDPDDMDEVTGDFRYDDIQGLVAALGALSTDSSRHRSKKERSAGRSAFRDILKSVESNERPFESLKLREYDVDFDGWVEITQLRFLRDRLTSGLQTHFVHNSMIHSILPATAILYSPVDANGGSATFGGSSGALGSTGSRLGSKSGSRAGSRPSSAMGIYADAEDAKAELDKVDRKYLNAEMSKLRQIQRRRDRGRDRFDDY
ncbi:Interferon- developmental regulator 1 [Lunasporangiospora selenospora]|uniref:Interferon- developmental regulator 1 n=1 Tax=Lunasporangiospora selenospora TaxID=979761 RepID=A0A9P6FRJ3_9FUNG|nr:Interferon- developmental regulator 1 [Lunasporangiospora selenospora]